MEQKLPPHPEHTMQWSPREQRVLVGHFEQAIEPLQQRIAELEAKELALHKILAESVLHANTGWARYEMANRMSNSLQAQLASRQGPVARVISPKGGPNNNPVVNWFVDFSGTVPNIKEGDKLYTLSSPAQQQPLSEREAFEAWAVEQNYEVKALKPDGRYWSSHTHIVWEAWQARAARLSPAQQPLSDEQIFDFGPGQPDAVWSYEDQLYFARAIEAAHGIGDKT